MVGDNGGCTAAMVVQIINLQQKVLTSIDQIKKPSLICTGTGDKIAAPSDSYLAHEKIQNSILKEYEGAFHLLHDELDETTEQYITDLLAFIQDNLLVRFVGPIELCSKSTGLTSLYTEIVACLFS